jgi:hypothetical protein
MLRSKLITSAAIQNLNMSQLKQVTTVTLAKIKHFNNVSLKIHNKEKVHLYTANLGLVSIKYKNTY